MSFSFQVPGTSSTVFGRQIVFRHHSDAMLSKLLASMSISSPDNVYKVPGQLPVALFVYPW